MCFSEPYCNILHELFHSYMHTYMHVHMFSYVVVHMLSVCSCGVIPGEDYIRSCHSNLHKVIQVDQLVVPTMCTYVCTIKCTAICTCA